MKQDELFYDLMHTHTDRMLRIAYYYTKDLAAAEDIVQDVFIKFYEKFATSQHIEETGAYLARMTANRSKDYLKSWHVRKVKFMEKWSEQATSSSENPSLILKDEQKQLTEAIMQLPLKHREILVYYYFEELTFIQIANILDLPQSTVKTRMTRAKVLLKQQLQDEQWEVLWHD
jgi:RNA polymerase sigma factor (sigma-70 family)